MATTSSNLAAGKLASQGDAGKGGNKGRAAAVATAALGLSLVVGGILGHGRQAQQAAQPQVSSGASAGARPVDASMTGAYRWDFGQARPADASVTVEYRWGFGSAVPALDWEQQERMQAAAGTLTNIAGETPCQLGGTAPCGTYQPAGRLSGGSYTDPIFEVNNRVGPADEYTQGEGAVPRPASRPGLEEYLPSDEPTSDGGSIPSPVFGPQP